MCSENTSNSGEASTTEVDASKDNAGAISSQTTSSATKKSADWNVSDPTDGRAYYEPTSKYPWRNRVEIFFEALYLALILLIAFYALIWIFSGDITFYHSSLRFHDLNEDLRKIVAFGVAGLIGGSMFGLKYLYHVTGRGLWHEDRRIWRIYSPWLAGALSVIMSMLIDGGLVEISHGSNTVGQYQKFISIGFMTGYFADTALAKLQEVATVIFGASNKGASASKN